MKPAPQKPFFSSTQKLRAILISCVLSTVFHIYLSSRVQTLVNGTAPADVLCHINDYVNCDGALLSNYSQFAGIHLSDWGIATNVVIAGLVISLLMSLAEHTAGVWIVLALFSLLSLGASLIMGGISFFILKLFCPVCLILYFLSFIIVGVFFTLVPLSVFKWKNVNIKLIFSSVVCWLVVGLLSHLMFINIHNNYSIEQKVRAGFLDWQSAPKRTTSYKPLLEKTKLLGKRNSIVMTEFADFLCSHCRNSYYMLKTLLSSNPNVHVQFFAFPLDGCHSDKSVSCYLTQAVLCAKEQGHGWNMHNIIFENQTRFSRTQTIENTRQTLQKVSSSLSLNWASLQTCMEKTATTARVKAQIQAGNDMHITGTPSLFINGKKINQRYFIQTLGMIRKHIAQDTK